VAGTGFFRLPATHVFESGAVCEAVIPSCQAIPSARVKTPKRIRVRFTAVSFCLESSLPCVRKDRELEGSLLAGGGLPPKKAKGVVAHRFLRVGFPPGNLTLLSGYVSISSSVPCFSRGVGLQGASITHRVQIIAFDIGCAEPTSRRPRRFPQACCRRDLRLLIFNYADFRNLSRWNSRESLITGSKCFV